MPTAHRSAVEPTDPAPESGQRIVGPARVVVDLDAIANNTRVLREHAGAAGVLAVVKADGYGHGLVPSARAALRGGATWLGTAQLDEAVALRRAGITVPVLSWLHSPGASFAAALTNDIDLGVSGGWALHEIASAAESTGRVARLHLKVDTGLGRNGAFHGSDWEALVESAARLEAAGTVQVVGVMSHFAYADAPDHRTVRAQQATFEEALEVAERAGLRPQVRHLANSAATLTNHSAAYDLVRPGIAIYGLSPVPEVGDSAHFGLRPAMRVATDIALVKSVPAGQGISYGHQYATSADTEVALLPLGYADGVPRNATNVGPVTVGGRRFVIAGRVCMDQIVLDIGAGAGIAAGDEAVLVGDGARGEPTAQEWADATGTISYEIVARMSSRLTRTYVGAENNA